MNLKTTAGTGFKLSPLTVAFMLMGYASTSFATESAAEEASTTGIEVITVTSTKRITSLMETGQAVSAFNEGAMEELGIKNGQDLVQYSPSLIISKNKVSIRGVGRPNNALGSDPGVGIYTDGVYNTENGVFSYCDFCDVERIEVLRGPQGTLYGRNAVGGAINLISKEPNRDFGGYLNVTAGNDGYLVSQGQLTGPLGDTFSAIATVSKMERDALQQNLATDGEDMDDRDSTYYSLTLKAHWNDNWTSSLRYMNSDKNEKPSPGYLTDAYPTDFVNFGAANLPGIFPGSNALNHLSGYTAANPAVADINKINVDTTGKLTVDTKRLIFSNKVTLGDLELKYTFGDYQYDYATLADGDVSNAALGAMNFSEMFRQITSLIVPDGAYLPNPADLSPITLASDMTASVVQSGESTSHELQLVSNYDDALNFIAGLYYYNSEESQYSDFIERGFGLMQGDAVNAYYGGLPPEYGLPADSGTFLGAPGWQVGLYQFYAALLGAPFEATASGDGGYLYYGQNNLETTATAAYGQLEYQLNEALKLTAGLRYSKDDKTGSDDVFAYLSVPKNQHQVDDSWSKVTWRLQADWQMDDNAFLYGYIATGYRSGGFNLGAATTAEPNIVDPEELTAFEVGYKKSLLDNNVNVSLAAYYYDYTDLQVLSAVTDGGITTVAFDNAAKASVIGLEVEVQALVTDDLQVTASYSYNQSEYDQYSAVDSIACAFGGECEVQDLSGNQLNMAPKSKFSLAATQYFELDDMGVIALTAGYSYVGEQYSRAFNRSDWDQVDSYDRIDARLSWTSAEQNYVVSAFVQNLGDNRNALRYDTPSTVTRMQNVELSDPISYGIQLRYTFE